MRQRPFAASTLVHEVGLGCWQLGGSWGELSDQQAGEILDTALGQGVDFLDTADVYGDGRSETLIGRALARHARRPFIATKCGRGLLREFADPYGPEALRAYASRSLGRLGIERLDLLQLHCIPPAQLARVEVWQGLGDLRREGLIRFAGASVETVAEGFACLKQPECRSLQIIFNIFRQKPAIDGLLEAAAAQGVAIIVRLPLASGLLSGRMRPDMDLAPDDHRRANADGQHFHVGETLAGLGLATGCALAEGLRPLLPATQSMAASALRWILDHPAVTVVIPGASRPQQVQANLAAAALAPLGPETHHRLRAYYREAVEARIRGHQ